ncbi:MAG: AbgT family transporter [Planctomycetes bacterium]|nr:AbgT family transporter [Planctomycetota bacterium]NOG55924.1 AbgT family transporter [Planctomycetota bacterium]
MTDSTGAHHHHGIGILDMIEWVGNKLPDPSTLFLIGAIIVMAVSHLAYTANWKVVKELPQVVSAESAEGGNAAATSEKQEVTWVKTDEEFKARSLLTRDGLYWAIKNMVTNFMNFPPLGVVLVGMLGIGIAERTGLLAAILKAVMLVVPKTLLTPTMVFVGIMSSMTLDAGYVVLPPLAAALYKSVGRSPLAGIAAVFAGVSAGFNANLFVTGLDPMLAGFSTPGAQTIDPSYSVAATCNWYFMAASTALMTLTGWAVTSFFVERRLSDKPADEGGPVIPSADELAEQELKSTEIRGLGFAGLWFAITFGIVLLAILIPKFALHSYSMPTPDNLKSTQVAEVWYPMDANDKPITQYTVLDDQLIVQDAQTGELQTIDEYTLDGETVIFTDSTGATRQLDAATLHYFRATEVEALMPGDAAPTVFPVPEVNEYQNGNIVVPSAEHFSRWVDSIVPIIFFVFIVPAIAYGFVMRVLRNDKDVAKLLIDSMAGMAPIIVLAFFAAQFTEYFKYSGLDKMLALSGGQALGKSGLSPFTLIVAFILVTLVFNLFVGSMSAKYAMFAPIFVPMFMLVGISPELTQCAYRIGDSVSNIITPLNAYLVIILVFMQKYVPKSGMGTLISTMLPYTVVFTIVWTIFMLIWMKMGWELGPNGPLWYAVEKVTNGG